MHTEEKERGSPEISYEELFGTPALSDSSEPPSHNTPQETHEPEQKSPYKVGNPEGEPPDPPPLLGVSRPARKAYERLHPVAWRYASDHMEIMRGVRKALKRAHKAAERAGGPSR